MRKSLQLNRYKSLKIYRKCASSPSVYITHRKKRNGRRKKRNARRGDQHTKYIHIISISVVPFQSHPPSNLSLDLRPFFTCRFWILCRTAFPIFAISSFILTVIEMVCICSQFRSGKGWTKPTGVAETHTHTHFAGKKQIRNDKKNLIIGAFKRFWMQIRTNTHSHSLATQSLTHITKWEKLNVTLLNDSESSGKSDHSDSPSTI